MDLTVLLKSQGADTHLCKCNQWRWWWPTERIGYVGGAEQMVKTKRWDEILKGGGMAMVSPSISSRVQKMFHLQHKANSFLLAFASGIFINRYEYIGARV